MAFGRQLHQVEGQFRTMEIKVFRALNSEGRLVRIENPQDTSWISCKYHGPSTEDQNSQQGQGEVCNTFREGGASIDLMRLKLFPFTLKDKAKIWLNSLRPRSIRNWVDLQAEFLKKFPTHRTNGLKRQISNFSLKKMRSSMNVGKEDGISPTQERKESFLSTNPKFKGGMYMLSEDVDMKAKVATLARRLEELELKKIHEVQAISDTQVHVMPCTICQSCDHVVDECPTMPAVREMLGDQVNVVGQFRPNNTASYGNTYNSSWRNHPNFSWKPRPPPYQPQGQTQAPQQPSSMEQAIVN
ncbi:hypothetical protein AAG906_035800 [Vitis piasezkii]